MSNVFEYALSTDPRINDKPYSSSLVHQNGDKFMFFAHKLNLEAENLAVSIEFSYDLVEWVPLKNHFNLYIDDQVDESTKLNGWISNQALSRQRNFFIRVSIRN